MSMNLRADDTFVEDEGWAHRPPGGMRTFSTAMRDSIFSFWNWA